MLRVEVRRSSDLAQVLTGDGQGECACSTLWLAVFWRQPPLCIALKGTISSDESLPYGMPKIAVQPPPTLGLSGHISGRSPKLYK